MLNVVIQHSLLRRLDLCAEAPCLRPHYADGQGADPTISSAGVLEDLAGGRQSRRPFGRRRRVPGTCSRFAMEDQPMRSFR